MNIENGGACGGFMGDDHNSNGVFAFLKESGVSDDVIKRMDAYGEYTHTELEAA